MTQVPMVTLNDGREIPQLGFGVWQIPDSDVDAAVTTALQVGYRHIDTAAMYRNEPGVGRAIAASGLAREDYWITTKVWNDRHGDAAASLAESLERLGLDYVDLALIHWPVPAQGQYVEAWKGLIQAKNDGLAKSIGVSNFNAEHLAEVIDATDITPTVNQIEAHPTFAQNELIKVDDDLGVKTEAWSPLGQSEDLNNPVIIELAQRLQRTPAQVILRWHIQRGSIIFPKSVTPQRIAENFNIFDFELTSANIAAIDGLDAGNRIGPDPAIFGQS